MMNREDRHQWIREYLKANRGGVNTLDAEFVDAYAEATGAKLEYTPYGANRCQLLGRDLKAMTDGWQLKRHRVPIPYDLRGLGFPLWVWEYELREVWRA